MQVHRFTYCTHLLNLIASIKINGNDGYLVQKSLRIQSTDHSSLSIFARNTESLGRSFQLIDSLPGSPDRASIDIRKYGQVLFHTTKVTYGSKRISKITWVVFYWFTIIHLRCSTIFPT